MHECSPFLNEWCDAGVTTLITLFGLESKQVEPIEILLASYTRDALSGEAFVLFKQEGKLYEVNASHDSSDGLYGQWEPEETLVAALRYRLENGRLGRGEDGAALFAAELAFLLAELTAKGYR